ncbi:hypothetical protein ABE504_32525 [Paenibacillus oryzisoli]|uniref:DUF6115 domain-containing protein n=1 Tax=Paenibacillus oryzisoli TaxID=1850517 RepID=UPI003D2C3BBC
MPPFAYVILLGLVLIVYARFLPKTVSAGAGKAKSAVQEIEETIEHFAAEMDEQNQAMLDLFTKTKHDYEVELAKLAGRLESLERQKIELSRELTKQSAAELGADRTTMAETAVSVSPQEAQAGSAMPNAAESHDAADQAAQPDPEPAYTGLSMRTRYSDLFALHDQGKSVEAIAKKLNMNKGEVNLILQLSRQEERTHV